MMLPARPSGPLRLLVVDDEPPHRELVAEIFDDVHHYRVTTAASAGEALDHLATGEFDILLLDNNMPVMTGLELCRLLRGKMDHGELPIILVTAMNDLATLTKGFAMGVTDFIGKPYSPIELEARVKSLARRKRAEEGWRRFHDYVMVERDVIERLLRRMGEVADFDGRGVRHLVLPVEKSGGDLVLAVTTPDGRQRILVGDITSHGLRAAMVTPLITHILERESQRGEPWETLLATLNHALVTRTPGDVYLAACLLEVDAARQEVMVFNAGLPDLLLMGENDMLTRIPSANLPLGILPWCDAMPIFHRLTPGPGERLYLVTDGAVECMSPTGEMFGLARLVALLAGERAWEHPLERIGDALRQHAAPGSPEDDITVMELTLSP